MSEPDWRERYERSRYKTNYQNEAAPNSYFSL